MTKKEMIERVQELKIEKVACEVEPQTSIKEETNTIIALLKQHGATNIISNLKKTHASFKFEMNNNNLTYRLFYLVNDEGGHEIGTDLFSASQNLDVMNLSEFKNKLTLKPCTIKEDDVHENIMDDLMGDINVCHELLRLDNIACSVGVKWDDLFCTEKDLLKALYQINPNDFKLNGQYYIGGFHKQLHKGEPLTPKQMTQLKRLAKHICLHYLRDTFHTINHRYQLKPKIK